MYKILTFIYMFLFIGSNCIVYSAEETSCTVKEMIDINQFSTNCGTTFYLYGTSMDVYDAFQKDFQEGLSAHELENLELGITKGFFKGTSLLNLKQSGINFASSLIKNNTILKIVDDHYGIIYINESGSTLNEIMLEHGYVELDDNLKNLDIDNSLIIAADSAAKNSVGIWDIQLLSKNKSPSVKMSSGGYFLRIQVYSIIISVVALVILLNKKTFFWIISYYVSIITCVANSILSSMENSYLHIINIIFAVLSIMICIILFVIFIIKKRIYKTWEIITKMILFVFYIILGFGTIYYSFSHIVALEHTLSRILPSYEIIDWGPTKPVGSYLMSSDSFIPNDVSMDSTFYFLSFQEALYFSATTFFGGSYGDVIPKGFLKVASVVEMALSYFIQVILFTVVTSLFIEKNTIHQPAHSSNNENHTSTPLRTVTYKKKWFKKYFFL